MKGADEYSEIFTKPEHIGCLYIVPSSHARGKTFRIYVLPKGEAVHFNSEGNPPLNENAVEVYGVISGQLGWTEAYGWIHQGKWISDFDGILAERKEEIRAKSKKLKLEIYNRESDENVRTQSLLNKYTQSVENQ